MVEIIGVGFMKAGKTYYFDPAGVSYELGELVIVETARGMELGHVSIANCEIEESELVAPLKGVERKASTEDLQRYKDNLARRDAAMKVCEEKILQHKLDMKLVDAEFTIDGSKVIFYFSADGRIDFRGLVKDLASHFRVRIELRQIGVRDEAKMLGGIGICDRPLCCSKWLNDFQPVSIKMAKQQNLSLNPAKISGTCGRLMCCLNFENKTYQELRKGMPNEGERIDTPDGIAKVVNVDLFNSKVIARLIVEDKETGEDTLGPDYNIYFKKEIKRIDKKHYNRKKDEFSELDAETLREIKELTRD